MGTERVLDVCFDTMDGGTQDLPRGALAMDATLSWRIDTETENIACPDATPRSGFSATAATYCAAFI